MWSITLSQPEMTTLTTDNNFVGKMQLSSINVQKQLCGQWSCQVKSCALLRSVTFQSINQSNKPLLFINIQSIKMTIFLWHRGSRRYISIHIMYLTFSPPLTCPASSTDIHLQRCKHVYIHAHVCTHALHHLKYIQLSLMHACLSVSFFQQWQFAVECLCPRPYCCE